MSKEIEKTNEMQEYSKDKIELIKRTYAKGSTDDEFALLLELSKRYNLDPFKKQIFYIPGTGILVSHAGMIHIAHQSGNWAGMKTFIITKDGEEKLIADDPRNIAGAVCYVYRKDWIEPLIHAVAFREYFKPSRSGYPSAWQKMPETMIKKVAEAGALRRAFDLGGLYIQEEMGEIENEKYDEKVEEPEIKEDKKVKKETRNNTYLARLMSLIEATEKKYNLNRGKIVKYLEKTFKKTLEEFNNEEIKKAVSLVNKIVEKQKAKQKEDEKIEVTVEEPEEPKNDIEKLIEKMDDVFEGE
jgi:phage recombination protein Bet